MRRKLADGALAVPGAADGVVNKRISLICHNLSSASVEDRTVPSAPSASRPGTIVKTIPAKVLKTSLVNLFLVKTKISFFLSFEEPVVIFFSFSPKKNNLVSCFNG